MSEGGIPTLEVGFAIETGGSFSELQRLQAMMNSTEATTLKAAAAVERQFGKIDLGGATAQVTTFGNAATRELQSVARESARVEKSGEGIVRQLQRQVDTFGKTSSEIRRMKADLAAASAESRGLTELAGRIRAVSAEMDRLEGGTGKMGGTGKLAGHHVQNLAFQVQDLGVQLVAAAQSGAPLRMTMMALVQQGSQIQGIMSQAGLGVGGLTKQLLAMAAPFWPLIAAIGVATTAFGLFSRSVTNDIDTDAMVRKLGLTKEEIKQLGDTSVGVGDVMIATF